MSAVMEEEIKRWTARRKSALVLEIIQGKTTVSEASRAFDITPSEIETWIEEGKRGLENALRAKPEDVREQYERQLKDLQEAYGETMRRWSAQYPRFGYRRINIYLEREGLPMSFDRTHRIWQQNGLQVPRKRPRKRAATSRPRPQSATGPNQVWAYDFVFDACANGQQLKCLTIVDEWTHECLAIDVQGSIRAGRVIEVLSRLVSEHGAPKHLRSDNGPEFVSHAVLRWLKDAGIDTVLNDPGKPWQNGTNESFNGKFRDECLSMEWFRTRTEARAVIENWRVH